KYALSGSINDQNGIILNTGTSRYQARLNLDHDFSKRFRVGLNFNYSENVRQGHAVSDVEGGNYTAFALYRTCAYRPVSGNPNIDLIGDDFDDEYDNPSDIRLNPIVTSQNDYTYRNSYNLMSNVSLEYDISKKLVWKSTFSISDYKSQYQRFY